MELSSFGFMFANSGRGVIEVLVSMCEGRLLLVTQAVLRYRVRCMFKLYRVLFSCFIKDGIVCGQAENS